MTAPDTRTLESLLDLAESERDTTLLSLRHAQDHLAQAQAQAATLKTYRTEYLERWSARFQGAAAIEILHCYRAFMLRLDQAVAQQDALVRRAEASCVQRRDALVAAETRVAAIGKLIGRRVEGYRRTVQRRDQKTNDEAAQRAGWNPGMTGDPGATW